MANLIDEKPIAETVLKLDEGAAFVHAFDFTLFVQRSLIVKDARFR